MMNTERLRANTTKDRTEKSTALKNLRKMERELKYAFADQKVLIL